MTVQDLYRIIPDLEEVEIKLKNGVSLWYGKNEDIPIKYFEKYVDALYSLKDTYVAYTVIEIAKNEKRWNNDKSYKTRHVSQV